MLSCYNVTHQYLPHRVNKTKESSWKCFSLIMVYLTILKHTKMQMENIRYFRNALKCSLVSVCIYKHYHTFSIPHQIIYYYYLHHFRLFKVAFDYLIASVQPAYEYEYEYLYFKKLHQSQKIKHAQNIKLYIHHVKKLHSFNRKE